MALPRKHLARPRSGRLTRRKPYRIAANRADADVHAFPFHADGALRAAAHFGHAVVELLQHGADDDEAWRAAYECGHTDVLRLFERYAGIPMEMDDGDE